MTISDWQAARVPGKGTVRGGLHVDAVMRQGPIVIALPCERLLTCSAKAIEAVLLWFTRGGGPSS
jgi:hypothetical protein